MATVTFLYLCLVATPYLIGLVVSQGMCPPGSQPLTGANGQLRRCDASAPGPTSPMGCPANSYCYATGLAAPGYLYYCCAVPEPVSSVRCPAVNSGPPLRDASGAEMRCDAMRPNCPPDSYCFATGRVQDRGAVFYCCPNPGSQFANSQYGGIVAPLVQGSMSYLLPLPSAPISQQPQIYSGFYPVPTNPLPYPYATRPFYPRLKATAPSPTGVKVGDKCLLTDDCPLGAFCVAQQCQCAKDLQWNGEICDSA